MAEENGPTEESLAQSQDTPKKRRSDFGCRRGPHLFGRQYYAVQPVIPPAITLDAIETEPQSLAPRISNDVRDSPWFSFNDLDKFRRDVATKIDAIMALPLESCLEQLQKFCLGLQQRLPLGGGETSD